MKKFHLLFCFILFALSAGEVSGATLDSCGNIENSSVITQNIDTKGSCLNLIADDITIDCQFNRIKGDGTGTGIDITDKNNVTITNCILENFKTAFSFKNSTVYLNRSLITGNNKGIFLQYDSILNTHLNSFKNNTVNIENTGINIIASNNWWGSDDPVDISTRITGNVNFLPFLSFDPYSDDDHDGLPYINDNCPSDFNPGQEDSDYDRRGNTCDMDIYLLNAVFDPVNESSGVPSKFTTLNETGYYIIQARTGISTDMKTQLEALNVEILEYIKQNALLTRFDPSIRPQIENLPFIRYVGIFQPAYKLETGYYQMIKNDGIDDLHLSNISVFVFRNISAVNDSITALGGSVIGSTSDSLIVQVNDNKILDISFIPDVKYITEEPFAFFFGFKTPITLGVRSTSNGANYGDYEGAGQVVGHFDTGIDTSHPDLQGQVIPDNSYTTYLPSGCTNRWGGGLENQDGKDKFGHGTSTGGVVVGLGSGGTSSSGNVVKGIAPKAKLFSTKICNSIGPLAFERSLFFGRFTEEDLVTAFSNAYGKGARVHTNSWGQMTHIPAVTSLCRNITGLATYRPYEKRLNRFIYEMDTDLPFFAASNTGRDFPDVITIPRIPYVTDGANLFQCSVYETNYGYGTLSNPAIAKNVITIGGTEQDLGQGCNNTEWLKENNGVYNAKFCRQADSDTDLWGGSSRGPTPDNRLKPDVVAPSAGRFVLKSSQADNAISEKFPSTLGPDQRYDFDKNRMPDEIKYRVSYGTSFATPAATSIGALIREFYNRTYNIKNPSAALLKSTVVNGAEDIPDRNVNDPVSLYSQTGPIPNFREGWGRVNFTKSIKPCADYKCLRFDQDSSLNETEKKKYAYRFSKDTRMEVTLSWTDPQDDISTGLINELSLEMESPAGKKYVSSFNNFDNNGESVPDDRNGVCRFVYVDRGPLNNTYVLDNIPASASIKEDVYCNQAPRITSNVKKLILNKPEDGFWNFTVKGKSVTTNFGAQHYGIVFSGIRGVDAINESGNLTKTFKYGERVFMTSPGLPALADVDIYVIPRSSVSNYDSEINDLDGIKVSKTNSTSDINGILDDIQIWNTSSTDRNTIIQQQFAYNIVIDVDRDGKFTPHIDLVDYHDRPGFAVLVCSEGTGFCAFIDSANSNGNKTDVFDKKDPEYARLYAISNRTDNYKIYLVKSNGSIDDLQDHDLLDISSNGPDTVNLIANQSIAITKNIWPGGGDDHPGGRYDIIIDVDNDNKFNSSIDVYDPDGLVISRTITLPRIAVDSNGDMHVVALERGKDQSGREFNNVLYAKIPSKQTVKINLKEPELFDWSDAQAVSFRAISNYSGNQKVSFPDIAVDRNNEAHIVYGLQIADFNWLAYKKLDKDGNPDKCMDRTDQSVPPAADRSNCDGNGMELIFYHWDDFEDIRLNFPSIAVDPKTNQSVISAEVSMAFPDSFYFNYIYPNCALGYSNIPIFVHAFVPFSYVLNINPGLQFFGDSIQVARRVPGSPGVIHWPFSPSLFPATYKKYTAASLELNNCIKDITTAMPRRQANWEWMPVEEGSLKNISFDVFSKIDVDNNSDIHVAYTRKENPADPTSQKRLILAKVAGNNSITRTVVSYNTPSSWFPWIDVDADNKDHVVWQSNDKIYYFTTDGTQREIATLNSSKLSRPSLSVDSQKNPHIVWQDKSQDKDILKYRKGRNYQGTITFPDPATILVNSSKFPAGTGIITFPLVDTNKPAKGDWTDRTFAGWLEISDKTTIKWKRTTPHIVSLLIIDGITGDFIKNNISNMPNMSKLMNDNPTIEASIFASMPDTTMSAQAEMMTGLKPVKNHVIGDNFKKGQPYNFYPDNNPDTSKINPFLKNEGITTLFDHLKNAKKSSAAIPAIITQGIGPNRPDYISQAEVDFLSGSITNENDRNTYLADLKNNDDRTDNDASDFQVAYILTHDHGINSSTIDPAVIDTKIGDIINALNKTGMLKDTIFIITSDHGLTDTIKDGKHSLNNSALPDLENPDNIQLDDMYLNGRFAFYYSNNNNNIVNTSRIFYTNSYNVPSSPWYGKIDRVILKDNSKYYNYYFNGSDVKTLANDQNISFSGSPDIILIARDGFYFQEEQESIYYYQDMLPFIVTGKGFSLFSRDESSLPIEFPAVNVAPTIGFFTGGKKVVDLMTGIDGSNFYDPQLVIRGGSPVNFHLYDSSGRHTGPDTSGIIEKQIPGSQYVIDENDEKKYISVLQAPDSYRLVISSFGTGAFGLSINLENMEKVYDVTYPRTSIIQDSSGTVNLTGAFRMEFDGDGDGTFERTIDPVKFITVSQDEQNMTALVSLSNVPANDTINIDASRSTDILFELQNPDSVIDGSIKIEKISDSMIDGPGFFTSGSYYRINISDNLLTGNGIKSRIVLPPGTMHTLSGKTLSIYEKDTRKRIDSTIERNVITATIAGSGQYVIASTDQIPQIEDIIIDPMASGTPGADLRISARITDNGVVADVSATLDNNSVNMSFNPSSGFFETTIKGPDISGTYPVEITAIDDNNNTATDTAYYTLDMIAPQITIKSPENISYVTNRINLIYYANEGSNHSYSIDGGPEILIGSKKAFKLNTIPLTLSSGVHNITVFATDPFGYRGTGKVRFGIETQNIRISNLEVPYPGRPDKIIPIKVGVTDTVLEDADGVEVRLLVNGNVTDNRSLNITGETTKELEFKLVLPAGRFNITAMAVPLLQEKFLDDNSLSKDIIVTEKVPVLLVDDDPLSGYSPYLDALNEVKNYDTVLYDVYKTDSPSTELLKRFPLVIWFTGEDGSLTSIEKNNLKSYLDNGGYLLLFGNYHKTDTDNFYRDYLFSKPGSISDSLTIEGAFRDPIGGGLLFNIIKAGEEIYPEKTATVSFKYSGGGPAAVRGDNGIFRSAYFAFGLEDISDIPTRNIIMERVLKFFDIEANPPIITDKLPASGTKLPKGTIDITLSLKTNEQAVCRLSDATNEFGAMTLFNTTNSRSHSTLVTNLTNGKNFTFFINCKDKYGNENNTENFSFYIHNRTFLPPVMENIPDISVDENEPVIIPINATDPENDALAFHIFDREISGYVPIASRFMVNDNNLGLDTNYKDAGIYHLRVATSDGFDTVTRDFILTIRNVNRKPVLMPIGNKTIHEGAFFTWTATANDPDGDDLTFMDDTTLFDINPFNGRIAFSPKNSQVGIYYVNISVSDSELSDHDIVAFNITNTNNPPVIEQVLPRKINVNDSFILQVNASDPDGNNLTFSDDTDLFDISATGLINFIPSKTQIGKHLINITVSDGSASATMVLNLVINQVNHPPLIKSITDSIKIFKFINDTFDINVIACDPDTDAGCE